MSASSGVRGYLGELRARLRRVEQDVHPSERALGASIDRRGLDPRPAQDVPLQPSAWTGPSEQGIRATTASGGIHPYLDDLRARLMGIEGDIHPLERALESSVGRSGAPQPAVPAPEPPPPPKAARRAATPPSPAPPPEPVIDIDKARPRGPIVIGERKRPKRYTLKESLYSRRRLRWVLLLATIILLSLAFCTAYAWNRDYQRRAMAKNTVFRMASAASYSSDGLDNTTDARQNKEVKEHFDYIAPDRARSRYLTQVRQPDTFGSEGLISAGCSDFEVAVVGATRYQKCNDVDSTDRTWRVDSYDPSVFDTPLFQPWVRFMWCEGKIAEENELQDIRGEKNKVFSCRVRNEEESNIIWERKRLEEEMAAGSDKAAVSLQARLRFIEQAKVDITVWVRESDGYIGRFAMVKETPGTLGTVTQRIDYVYYNFNVVEPIEAPDMSEPTPTPSPGAGQTVPKQAILNGFAFNLEVAADDVTRMKGLSNRASFPRTSAMLFVFPREQQLTFWMKDTLIPLDVVFIDRTLRIVDIQTMEPQPGATDSELLFYTSKAAATYALELNAGVANELGLQVGQVITLR